MTRIKHPTNRYERLQIAEKKKRQRKPPASRQKDEEDVSSLTADTDD